MRGWLLIDNKQMLGALEPSFSAAMMDDGRLFYWIGRQAGKIEVPFFGLRRCNEGFIRTKCFCSDRIIHVVTGLPLVGDFVVLFFLVDGKDG